MNIPCWTTLTTMRCRYKRIAGALKVAVVLKKNSRHILISFDGKWHIPEYASNFNLPTVWASFCCVRLMSMLFSQWKDERRKYPERFRGEEVINGKWRIPLNVPYIASLYSHCRNNGTRSNKEQHHGTDYSPNSSILMKLNQFSSIWLKRNLIFPHKLFSSLFVNWKWSSIIH